MKAMNETGSRMNWEAYESSAVSYSEKVENLYPHHEAGRFLSMIPPSGKIIDIGCGSGRDAKVFSEKGFQVTGVDFSPKMIEIAKEKAPQADFYVMDMRSLKFDPIFDGAWANASLLHITKNEILNILKNILMLLKPNALFYIYVQTMSIRPFMSILVYLCPFLSIVQKRCGYKYGMQ